jgi:prolyl-tRNA synthetase
LINQWGSVVRWELRTKLFLRTAEFYWQEGHTAHATEQEAREETMRMLDVYADFAINEAAIPVIKGIKSDTEKFAGAVMSTTIEAMMGDTKALQSGTSHFLGQNFAKAFDIQYTDKNNELQHAWTTSWGLSTRMVGAIIMTHGDDKGLVLPPRLAPIQVVIVPIYRNETEKSLVMETANRIFGELKAAGIRLKMDDREEVTPGFKYNDWEMRGVPVRMEIGPKDLEKNSVALARRDRPGREGKTFVSQENLAASVANLLNEIQAAMLAKALAFRDSHIHNPSNMDELAQVVQNGWAFSWWCESKECETRVKEATKASTRCIPVDQPEGSGVCIVCGRPATRKVIFGKSY